jgi:hypothetical protein
MHARAALRVSLFSLGLSVVLASAQTRPALSVTPDTVQAGQSFWLYLQGLASADCYTTFAHESVTVVGTRINLRYTSQKILYPADSPAAPGCPMPVVMAETVVVSTPAIPNMPTFLMPALRAGKYEVWASDVPACLLATPTCTIAEPAPVSAGTLEVQTQAEPAFTFSPLSAPAGRGFDLNLLSYHFTCATIYENLVVQVVGDVINLSFLYREPSLIACPAIYAPYGPTFKIPALAAGTYQVRVNAGTRNVPVALGNLQITPAVARRDWYLKQRTVPPDAGFQLQILHDSLAACTNFSNLNAVASAGGINLYFLRQTGKCSLMSQEPIGPQFTMPALKAGRYPVFVTELEPCEVAQPACILERVNPLASDTLFVGNSLAVRMSDLHAGALKVDVVGNTAFFTLPDIKPGIWKAELMTLDGRVLAMKSIASGSGERMSMPVDRARANAVSLLRLTTPEGRQSFLPIVR